MLPHTLIECLESRIAPAGLVAVEYDAATGRLTLTGDDEPNAFEILQVAPGVYRIEGQEDAGTLENTSIGTDKDRAMTFRKVTSVSIASHGGNDEIKLTNLRTLKDLTIDTGSGNDELELYNVSVAGNASIATGDGADIVETTGLSTVIGKNLSISDSEGGVVFHFGAGTAAVRGALTFTGGTGDDLLAVAEDTNLLVAKGIVFDGGLSGSNQIDVGGQAVVKIGRGSSGQSMIFNGGSGVDRISVSGNAVSLLGSVEMNGGGGADLLDLDGVRVTVGKAPNGASITLAGGDGTDEIDIQGNQVRIAGSVVFDGGLGADFLDLTNARSLTVQGGINFMGGAGSDLLEIEADLLRLLGGLSFTGGDDADAFRLAGDGTVAGALDVDLGAAAAGSQSVTIRGISGLVGKLKINGSLTVNATGAAASTDVFRLTNVNVSGATTLTFGEGVSDVDMDNLVASGPLTIDTRGGADSVRIETDGVYGASVFKAAASILLGEGDDTLRMGQDSGNNRVLIMAQLIARGGGGTDVRNDLENDNRLGRQGAVDEDEFETISAS